MLALDSVEAGYGQAKVLHGVSLTVEPGEIVVLLGANGAGKTTTLRVISGIIGARGGVTFEGRPLIGMAPNRIVELGLLQVPEGRQLFADMSVEDNLLMGSHSARAKPHRARALEQSYALFPVLKERRTQKAGTLSGGQQQMLAIGRALMAQPRLLLLDEPSLGLAPQLVTAVFEAIRRSNESGMAILLVEQNANQALRFAHRGYVLEGGRVVHRGSASELADDPAVQRAYLGLRAATA
ncbi:MAG: ABC transporter ATP-binding protein [Alphaproteobacteria bacterium]|nr:ABC transporter ATP-binding protein [Alphaproteobacteria bacterium]